jgi:hypothetical protein
MSGNGVNQDLSTVSVAVARRAHLNLRPGSTRSKNVHNGYYPCCAIWAGSVMKLAKYFLFTGECALVFLVTAAVSCGIRTKYYSVPNTRAGSAALYADLLQEYYFLQYNQAGDEQGKAALLEYIAFLEKTQTQVTNYPASDLHFNLALSYLRLYRLEMTANNPAKASEYLQAAQRENAMLGGKDISVEQLIKAIKIRESDEAKLYNNKNEMISRFGIQ